MQIRAGFGRESSCDWIGLQMRLQEWSFWDHLLSYHLIVSQT